MRIDWHWLHLCQQSKASLLHSLPVFTGHYISTNFSIQTSLSLSPLETQSSDNSSYSSNVLLVSCFASTVLVALTSSKQSASEGRATRCLHFCFYLEFISFSDFILLGPKGLWCYQFSFCSCLISDIYLQSLLLHLLHIYLVHGAPTNHRLCLLFPFIAGDISAHFRLWEKSYGFFYFTLGKNENEDFHFTVHSRTITLIRWKKPLFLCW